MINVFTTIYTEKNRRRSKELELCVSKNLADPKINYHPIEQENRPTFNDFFKIISDFRDTDGVNVISNTDIYFDESILVANDIPRNHVYALNRWDWVNRNTQVHYNMLGSADVWVFRGIPENINGDFVLGKWGCDGRLGHEIVKAGYELLNPSLSIKTIHYHPSGVHHYSFNDLIPGPYVGAPACHVAYLEPAVTFTAVPCVQPVITGPAK